MNTKKERWARKEKYRKEIALQQEYGMAYRTISYKVALGAAKFFKRQAGDGVERQ